jgi:outer membrane protein assembly factor BamB
MRSLVTSLATTMVGLGIAAAASAQFDGPAPLAWRWSYPATAAPSGSPLVIGESVYAAIGGRVFGIDRSSGNLKWRFPQLDPIPGAFRSSPVAAAGTLVAIGSNRLIYGINPDSGESKWTYNAPGTPVGQPIVVANKYVVFAQSNNSLVALDAANGEPAWTAPYSPGTTIVGNLGSYDGNVLYYTQDAIVSLNLTTQKREWRTPLNVPQNAAPIVRDGVIYANSGTFLVALNAAEGNLRWQVDTKMALAYAPTVSAAGILVTTAEGMMKIYSDDRQLISKTPIQLSSGPVANPTVAGSKFIVVTANGDVNLIDPAVAAPIWNYTIRPLGDAVAAAAPAGGGGFGPGGGGGFGGPAGGGQGGGLGGPPGGFGGGQGRGAGAGAGGAGTTPATKVVFVQASGPAVLAGKTLIVPAKDGSILAFDNETGVDLTPPKVTLSFPNPGDPVSGQPPLFLLLKMEDEASGIIASSLTVEVDGKPLLFTTERDGSIVIRFSSSQGNKPLTDGRKQFIITVSDWMGNVTKQQFFLTIDNTLAPIVIPSSSANPAGGPAGGGSKGGGGIGGGGGGDD